MIFKGRKTEKESKQDREENKITEIHTQIYGNLTFPDPVDLRINGKFTGSLDFRGTLTTGESSEIEANISGDNIIIAGKVKGDVTAHQMLVLMPTAILRGSISTPKLNIVEGALFRGSCQMIDELLDIDEVSKYLEIDMREIEALANSGKIPGKKTGNKWEFERTKIDHWAAAGKVV